MDEKDSIFKENNGTAINPINSVQKYNDLLLKQNELKKEADNLLADKKYEDAIFKTILHPEVEAPPEGMNKLEILMYKTRRFFSRTLQTSKYTGEPVMTTILKTIVSKIHNSSTLFKL